MDQSEMQIIMDMSNKVTEVHTILKSNERRIEVVENTQNVHSKFIWVLTGAGVVIGGALTYLISLFQGSLNFIIHK